MISQKRTSVRKVEELYLKSGTDHIGPGLATYLISNIFLLMSLANYEAFDPAFFAYLVVNGISIGLTVLGIRNWSTDRTEAKRVL